MIVVIGLVGFLGAIFMFVCAILLWIQGLTWYGIVLMFVGIYYIIQTMFLTRLDGKKLEHDDKINKLAKEVKLLKEKLGFQTEEDEEESEDGSFDEENYNEFFQKEDFASENKNKDFDKEDLE